MFHTQKNCLFRFIQLLIISMIIPIWSSAALAMLPPLPTVLVVCDLASCENPHEASYLEQLQMAGYAVDTIAATDILPEIDLTPYSFVYAGFFWASPNDPRVDNIIDAVVANATPLLATDPAFAVQWGLAGHPPQTPDAQGLLGSVWLTDQTEIEIIEPWHPIFQGFPELIPRQLLPVYSTTTIPGDPAGDEPTFIGVLADDPSLSPDAMRLAHVYHSGANVSVLSIVGFPPGAQSYSGSHGSPTAPFLHLGMGNETAPIAHENFWQIFRAAAKLLNDDQQPGGEVVDQTAPVTGIDLAGSMAPGGRYTSAVRISLMATDEAGGSGLSLTEYRLNGSSWTTYTGPFTIFSSGWTTIIYRSVDIAGNREFDRQATLSIDLNRPAPSPRDFLFTWGSFGGTLRAVEQPAPGKFNLPSGIAMSGNELYVADDYNSRIQVFDADGNFLRQWGSYGTGNGQFYYPNDVAVDGEGRVYVLEAGNSRVQVFDKLGNFLTKWGTYGTGNNQLWHPDGIAVDAAGNVYVSNHDSTIRAFDSYGNFLRKWGGEGSGAGQLDSPIGIAVDEQGLVYVVEQHNHRVSVFDSLGNFVNSWGSQGYADGQFAGVSRGIVIDSKGYVYIADSSRIQVFDRLGNFVTKFGSGGTEEGRFHIPHGLAFNPELDRIYVADQQNHRIQAFGEKMACPVNANAGPDRLVEQVSPTGTSLILDASLSTSNCGEALSYTWSWPGGSATGKTPEITLPVGTTTLSLTARGSSGLQATGSQQITVADSLSPTTGLISSVAKGNNGWFVSPATLTLTASDTGSGVKTISYAIDAAVANLVTASAAHLTLGSDGVHSLSYFAEDFAGNREVPQSQLLRIDMTAPNLTIDGVTDGATYLVGAPPAPTFTAEDSTSGLASAEGLLSGGNANGLGSYRYRVTASDLAGNQTEVAADYQMAYGFNGFLPPVSHAKPLKLGRTIPVKFTLSDAFAANISTAVASIRLQQVSNDEPVGEPIEPEATNGEDNGNLFRYDGTEGLYIYNLRTRDAMTSGSWEIQVLLDDGSTHSITLQLK